MSKSLALLGLLVLLAPRPASAQLVFLPPESLPTASSPSTAQVGDVNGDLVPDVVVVDGLTFGQMHVRTFLGHGDGDFTAVEAPCEARANFVRLADVDNDGALDLVLSEASTASATHLFGVLRGDGHGGFGGFLPSYAGAVPRRFALGQLDQDGVLDAVVLQVGSNPSVPAEIRVLGGDGTGQFVPRQSVAWPTPGTSMASSCVLGDFDEDARNDLVVASEEGLFLYRGLGNGLLDEHPMVHTFAGVMERVLAADLDGDGHLDLAVSAADYVDTNGGCILFERGHGDGHFDLAAFLRTGDIACGLAVGDLDGDADLDLLAIRRFFVAPSDFVAFANDGSGGFVTGLQLSTTANILYHELDPQLSDLDADGRPDLVLSTFMFDAHVYVALDRSYLPGSPFLDEGHALAGTKGFPILLAGGSLAARQQASLALWNAAPGAPVFAVAGTDATFSPFHGGTLVPQPQLLLVLGAVASADPTSVSFRAPASAGGLSVHVQFWIADMGGAKGFAATTGVRLAFP